MQNRSNPNWFTQVVKKVKKDFKIILIKKNAHTPTHAPRHDQIKKRKFISTKKSESKYMFEEYKNS